MLLFHLVLFALTSSSKSDKNVDGRSSLSSLFSNVNNPFAIHLIRNKRDTEDNDIRDVQPPSKILKLIFTDFEATVVPKVASVDSSSAKIYWTLSTIWNGDPIHEERKVNISLKVNFRPFGSVTTREIILTIHESSLNNDFRENSYTISNLIPDTGYVICFSLLLDGNYAQLFSRSEIQIDYDSDIKETPATTTVKSDNASKTSQENADIDNPILKVPDKATEDKTDSIYPTSLGTELEQGPFINYPSPRSRSQLPLPQGNFAYTSTGELIFMPPSAWRPPRRKRRGANVYGRDVEETSDDLESDRFCVEIITKPHLALSVLSPIMILIYLIILVLIIVFVLLLLYFLRKCFRKYTIKTIIKKEAAKDDEMKCQSEVKICTPRLDRGDLAFQSLKISTALAPKSSHLYANGLIKALDESSPSVGSATYQDHPEKQDEYVFHPGYEIPPSSTLEVYGYDFPKASNRTPTIPATPSTSSCDFNINEFVWDFPTLKSNFNIPLNDSNRSEVFRDTKPRKHFSHTLFPKRSQINEAHDGIYNPACRRCKNKICECFLERFIRTTQDGTGTEDNLFLKREKLSNLKLGERVTISGGTLLEVPEGYVIPRPKPSERVKIIIKGPVEL